MYAVACLGSIPESKSNHVPWTMFEYGTATKKVRAKGNNLLSVQFQSHDQMDMDWVCEEMDERGEGGGGHLFLRK